MNDAVDTKEKVRLLRTILRDHHFEKQTCIWLLNYLLEREKDLHLIHFVENAQFLFPSIVMTTDNVEGPPFRFFQEKSMTSDVEIGLGLLKFCLNNKKPLYIDIRFLHRHQHPDYAAVLEENPNAPFPSLSPQESQQLDEFLQHSITDFQVTRLQKEIDQALQSGDKLKFLSLTEELNQMKKR